MNSRFTRRQYVAAVTTATLASTGGCLDRLDAGLSGETEDRDPEGDTDEPGWTTYRGDAAKSGTRPARSGPGTSLSVAWELEVSDLLEELEGLEADEYALEKPLDDSDAFTRTRIGTSSVVLTGSVVVWTIGYSWVDTNTETETEKYQLRVIAADRETGTIEWSYELETPEESLMYDWFAPEVGERGVYVPHETDDGIELVVYDPDTGEVAEDVSLELPHEIGQPLVADGTVYVVENEADGATLHAFDAADSTSEWAVEHPTGGDVGRGIPDVTVRDGTVWSFDSGSTSESEPAFVARDAADGSVRFREPLELPEPTVTGIDAVHLSTPTVAGESGYAAGDIESYVLRDRAPLVSFDPTDGSERWQYEPPAVDFADRTVAAIYGLPIVVDGLVLATGLGDPDSADGTNEDRGDREYEYEDHYLFAIDEADGTVEWSMNIPSPVYAPIAAGDVVYLSFPNTVYAISTSGEHLDRLGKAGLRPGDYPPAIGGGRLFTATRDSIVAIE
ncbi:PQQ-like beta-propeller repeat protein [Halobacteria archaeon AArc-m2/3/4]|uniref:PQQ-like beta-propeller repeat protein n=1 Tax=Natronoglomus mannanivorans TaxID=2979990 RepID=A0ABT2QHS5_9EURY|nr:PQQ-like beta-propeller repeat protein [Halobacteria archaeon AArc-m2/3/4]